MVRLACTAVGVMQMGEWTVHRSDGVSIGFLSFFPWFACLYPALFGVCSSMR